ncbi:MAG: hypothetical protein ACON4Z_17715 [Planctomycetota bacterium]
MTTATDDLLLGADLREVRARYGAPLGCAFDGEALWLTYLGKKGDADEAAMRLVDGVVVDAGAGLIRSPATVCDEGLVGEPVERAIAQLGAPRRIDAAGGLAALDFGDRRVTVYEGVVACVEPVLPSVFVPSQRASA